ncbi:DnaA regulatory inactivator HdaA [Chelativorans intermedius]|uniref:DnaA regulatory inactivator HdaA n=1 Tax=Chelativorans intermedius TaxID=515947 RepID=A0ABV6D4Y0_9HYPH|nr:DnaA regulatory inactivator HdaA [Chelativorans intermedius]MCT8999007.1 DnaA regulatory inactivator HdaA [Chelativorans intermedius]
MTKGRPRQLPLELAHEEARSRDDLVVTPANARAVALVEGWPDWPSPVVVLAGPAGAGKSHLGAIWCARADALAVPAGHVGADAFAAAERGPVLIDDADAPGRDERGLFHLINTARSAGHHLLLTARRFPAAWGVALPDLLSRLKAAALVEIGEPDDMLLSGVIFKLFADRQVAVEPHVVQFLVRRIERSLSAAQQVVERLDRAALERKARITRALAAEVIGAMEAG